MATKSEARSLLLASNANLESRASVLQCAVGSGALSANQAYKTQIRSVIPSNFTVDELLIVRLIGSEKAQLESLQVAVLNGRIASASPTNVDAVEILVPDLGPETISDLELVIELPGVGDRPAQTMRYSGLIYTPLEVDAPTVNFVTNLTNFALENPTTTFIGALLYTFLTMAAIIWYRERAISRRRDKEIAILKDELRRANTPAEAEFRPVLGDDASDLEQYEPPPVPFKKQHPPADLIAAVVEGNAVGFAGLGVSMSAGLPGYASLFDQLIDQAESDGMTDKLNARSLRLALEQGRWLSVADWITNAWRQHDRTLAESIERVYGRIKARPSALMKKLASLQLPFMTTWATDTVFDEVFQGKLLVSSEAEEALDRLSRGDPTFLKLYGDIDHPADLTVSTRQFETYLAQNDALTDLLSRLFYSRTIMFVGLSFDGLEDLLASMPLRGRSSRRHYALVGCTGEDWKIVADGLLSRYGVEVVPLDERIIGDEAERIIDELGTAVKDRASAEPKDRSSSSKVGQSVLESVRLTNIGPFDELSIGFDETWNLFLGDNGVGKSTVLKAIAIALLGDHANTAAERIIRAGSPSAEIELRTQSGNLYKTILKRRSGGGFDIETIPSPPMETENWLAIGFPALRTTSWKRPGYDLGMGAGRPTRDDLLPILTDEPDPRLDGLKQRIITLDYIEKSPQADESRNALYARLLEDLFKVFNEITEGLNIQFENVDPVRRAINIRIDDVILPIEALSQGTISLISWVGVILQRFYEVAPDGTEPRNLRALVLIDEIDAHMHPAWQTTVLSDLKSLFPAAQFIATTHSPLVVRGLNDRQVFRFSRDEKGKAGVASFPKDATMGRPDQILSGELFRVDPKLDDITEDVLKRYQDLLGRETLEEAEEKELRALSDELEYRIPNTYSRADDRRAMDLVTSLLEAQAFGTDESINKKLEQQARDLLAAARKEGH